MMEHAGILTKILMEYQIVDGKVYHIPGRYTYDRFGHTLLFLRNSFPLTKEKMKFYTPLFIGKLKWLSQHHPEWLL